MLFVSVTDVCVFAVCLQGDTKIWHGNRPRATHYKSLSIHHYGLTCIFLPFRLTLFWLFSLNQRR